MKAKLNRSLWLIITACMLTLGLSRVSLQAQSSRIEQEQMAMLYKKMQLAEQKNQPQTLIKQAKQLETLAEREHSLAYYLYAQQKLWQFSQRVDNKDEEQEKAYFDKIHQIEHFAWLSDKDRCFLALYKLDTYYNYGRWTMYQNSRQKSYGKREEQKHNPRYWSKAQFNKFITSQVAKIFAYKGLFDTSAVEYQKIFEPAVDVNSHFDLVYNESTFNVIKTTWSESLGALMFLDLTSLFRHSPNSDELADIKESIKQELGQYIKTARSLDSKIGASLFYYYDFERREKSKTFKAIYQPYLGKKELKAYLPIVLNTLMQQKNKRQTWAEVQAIEKAYPHLGKAERKALQMLRERIFIQYLNVAKKSTYVVGHKNLTLQISHIQMQGMKVLIYQNPYLEIHKNYIPKAKDKPIQELEFTFEEDKDWNFKTDTITLHFPKTGAYCIKFIPQFNPRIREAYDLMRQEHAYTQYEDIYVTNKFALLNDGDTYAGRVQWLNALTGEPLKGLRVKSEQMKNDRLISEQEFVTDKEGFVQVPQKKRDYYRDDYLTALDKDDPLSFLFQQRGYYGLDGIFGVGRFGQRIVATLNTDRPIYKAGQTVEIFGYVAEIAHLVSQGHILANEEIRLSIVCKGKTLEEVPLKTDKYGNYTYRFKLAENCDLGSYALHLNYKDKSTTMGVEHNNFRVEAYQRPTYELSVQKPKTGYRLGDTIQIETLVKEMNGSPLKDCRLTYSIQRKQYLWFFFGGQKIEHLPQIDLISNAEGKATASIVLTGGEDENKKKASYVFDINVQATSPTGEVQTKALQLLVGDELANIDLQQPNFIEQNDKSQQCTIKLTDFSKNKLAKTLFCQIRNKQGEVLEEFRAKSNEEISLYEQVHKLKSGIYTLRASLRLKNGEVVSKEQQFVLWNKGDKLMNFLDEEPFFTAPSDESLRYAYDRYDTLPYIYYATAFDVPYIFYDVHDTEAKLIKKGLLRPKAKQINRLDLPKPKSLDSGLTARLYFVHNGKIYKKVFKILPRQKEQSLSIKWETLRHRVQAGSKEEWRAKIYQDGKPVKASVSAWLYDASLNNLVQNFRKPFLLSDRLAIENKFSASLSPFANNLDIPDSDYNNYHSPISVGLSGQATGLRVRGATSLYGARSANYATLDNMVVTAMGIKRKAKAMPLRRDFSETAFCYPKMLTEKDGSLTLSFTMPESLTRWQLYLMAHTKDLHQALYSDEIETYRELELKPFMPRFLRSGDKVSIAYSLRNLSDKANNVQVQVEYYLLEAGKGFDSAKPLNHSIIKTPKNQTFNLNPNEAVNGSFVLEVPNYDTDQRLGIRIKAIGKSFSDGEEHILEIKSNKVAVERTQAITLHSDTEQGKSELISLDSIYPHNFADLGTSQFTFSLESNPLLYALDALPALVPKEMSKNSIGLLTNYYALAMASKIAEIKGLSEYLQASKPELKSFFDDMANEKLVAERKAEVIAKLKKLQDEKGYFSWFEGMSKSDYLTEYILSQLMKLQPFLPQNEDVKQMTQKAWEAYQEIVVKDIKHLKKDYKSYPKLDFIPRRLLNFVYLSMPLNKSESSKVQPEIDDVIELILANKQALYQLPHLLRLRAGILLSVFDPKLSKELLQSVKEYIVKDKDGTCYFPSAGSYYWRNPQYELQAEMILYLTFFENSNKDLVRGLKQWLLREKRATKWESDVATLDALDALLIFGNGRLELPRLKSSEVTLKSNDTSVKHLVGKHIDFTKDISKKPINRALIQVKGKGEVWAMAKLNYQQKMTEVKSGGKELRLERAYYLKKQVGKDMVFTELKEGDPLHKGDVIEVRLYIKLDRAMDFVQISDPRLLFAEHLDRQSRYVWNNPLTTYYYEVGQEATKLYFNRLARGEYNFRYEQAVVRSGIFALPNASAKSLYAPEYSALTPFGGHQTVSE